MSTIQAVYRNGVFEPKEPVDLPEGCEVTVELPTTEETAQERAFIIEGKRPADDADEQIHEALMKLS